MARRQVRKRPRTRNVQEVVKSPAVSLRARYDAAMFSPEDVAHWKQIDNLSSDAANNPKTRKILRERCRYEVANNSYAFGAGMKLANLTIGTGPTPNILTGDKKLNSELEWLLAEWMNSINLTDKLATLRMDKYQSGEGVAIIRRNPVIPGYGLTTDLLPFECDRLKNPDNATSKEAANPLDGVELDKFGNPAAYWISNRHPGDSGGFSLSDMASVRFPAYDVVHYYSKTRSEQHRGIPELTSCLKLFAQLRRVTLAVAQAFETAANVAIIFSTDLPSMGSAAAMNPYDRVPIVRGTGLVLPEGWKPEQMKAEQPTTTFAMFRREILTEIGQCLQMPCNVITGDSSEYNFASGRLDQQVFFKSLDVERERIVRTIITPLVQHALQELEEYSFYDGSSRINAIAKRYMRVKRREGWIMGIPAIEWRFPMIQHVDPIKEANAHKVLYERGAESLYDVCAAYGKDVEDVQEQKAREQANLIDLTKKYKLPEQALIAFKDNENESTADRGDSET